MAELGIAVVGEGAIATGLLQWLRGHASVRVAGLIVKPEQLAEPGPARSLLPAPAEIVSALPQLAARPDLLVECAGHGALKEHVIPALRAGVSAVVVSTGALSDPELAGALEEAATAGGSHVYLTPGAVGGIDALAAARLGGLERVTYVGRKPPGAWQGTPAQDSFDLDGLTEAVVIFEGSAREAASLYPRNANVAATVALAGLGMERTTVQLVADPGVSENVHTISASGVCGTFEITLRGAPLPANPKTSALTVYAVARLIDNLARPVSL